MMSSATIKLFLLHGDAKRLRTAEISNWSGKAIAAPRTEVEELLLREELQKSGVYVLIGTDPESGLPHAYIGEAEKVYDRIKKHKEKDFWVSAIVFVSKDENLTKAHIRFLEGRIIIEAEKVGRFTLENDQGSGSKLPESDRYDMEVFLNHVRQLLPVLGSDLLIPTIENSKKQAGDFLYCSVKGVEAKGLRTPDGFVVLSGSAAVLDERPAAHKWPASVALRRKLISDGILVKRDMKYEFVKDVEFTSPSAAAAVVDGGSANGLIRWKSKSGVSLKDLD